MHGTVSRLLRMCALLLVLTVAPPAHGARNDPTVVRHALLGWSALESRIAVRLVRRLRPAVSIWFHQPYGLVDESGGDVGLERRFAERVGLPLVRLPQYPGSATSWENHVLPGTTAFVVELHGGAVAPQETEGFVSAVRALAAP